MSVMKKNSNFIKIAGISFAVILLTILSLIFLRSLPVTKIWNSYSVVYVDKILDEGEVLSFFEKEGIQNVVSFSNQKIPVVNEMTPVIPQTEGSYLFSRLKYFSDKSFKYNLFYVPQIYEGSASKAVNKISSQRKVSAGMDGKKQFPWAAFCISCAVYFVFFALSGNKTAFALSGIFPLFMTLSLPFYPVAAAVILFLLAFYLAQRIWGRKGFILFTLKNFYFDALCIFGFLMLFLFSWRSALLSVFCVASSLCLLYFLACFENYCDSKNAFSYVKIFSAKQMPIMYRQKAFVCAFTAVPLLVCVVLFFVSARFSNSKNSRSVSLPGPVENTAKFSQSDLLPTIDDFYKWDFYVESFPYRQLNNFETEEKVSEEEKILINRFKNTEKGIEVFDEEIMIFDDSFKSSADKKIDELSNDSIEKFLRKQGRNLTVAYTSNFSSHSASQNDVLSSVLLIAALLVPALMSLFYFVFGKNDEICKQFC